MLGACTRDEIEDNSYPLSEYDGTGVLFRLKAESFDDTGSATRTVDLTAPFDTLCAYILKVPDDGVSDPAPENQSAEP